MYKDDIERHEQYKKYAELAYGLKLNELPKDKIPLYKSENKDNGFSAYSVKDGDRVVIVYRGTDVLSPKDWRNNKNMGKDNQVPSQTKDALRFYDQMKEKYPNAKIDVVGHSLGGSLSEYVATQREVNQAVNFNPYGTGKSQKEYLSKYESKTPMDRIINYNNSKDTVSDKWSKDTQVGTNYSVETDKTKANPIDPLKHHWTENMMPLSTSKQGNPSYDIEGNKPVIKSSPKPAWDKHGNLTGLAADIGIGVNDINSKILPQINDSETKMFNKQAIGHEGNKAIRNNLDMFGQYNPNNTNNGKLDNGSGDEFKINASDILKKDSPYIDKTNTIDNFDVNKNSILPTKTNNSFTDLIKKSSALNNNVSIDNQDLIAKNSTLGGLDNNFINKVKGKRFQDLSDEERLKAIWHYLG